MPLHDVTVRLQKTPWALYGWQSVVKAHGGKKRGADGKERRSNIALHELLTAPLGIYIAVAVLDAGNKHAIVWDGWRRVLFIGPGEYDDRGLDGALLVEQADIDNALHVNLTHGVTLTEYVRNKFGLVSMTQVAVLMCRAKRWAEVDLV